MNAREPGRRRIVIAGGGFAGAWCADGLSRRMAKANIEVCLIDRQNYLVFYPLLVEAGTGGLEPRHTVVSLRTFLPRVNLLTAEIEAVDLGNRQIHYRLPEVNRQGTLAYDHLVVAVGSVTRLPDVPGLHAHGFEMKSLADAVALRDHAIQMLDLAEITGDPATRQALLHFVVVGANFTGVEVAGEFLDFLRHAARQYRVVRPSDVRITLIELSGRVLGALDEELSDYAARQMTRCGIEIRLNESVTRIEADRVVLRSGGELATHTLIWAAGIAPSPLLAKLDLPKDQRGYLRMQRDLRVEGHDNVWAIGDCAAIPGPDGRHYPATAQHAVREAAVAADNILRVLRGESTRRSDIASAGSLAAIGCRMGVAKVFGIRLSGFLAWWMYRSYYLMRMPGLARKVRVGLDWALNLIFPREYVQLNVHRRTRGDR